MFSSILLILMLIPFSFQLFFNHFIRQIKIIDFHDIQLFLYFLKIIGYLSVLLVNFQGVAIGITISSHIPF